ncbi:hypothetical protein SAMN04487980_105418 [Streptomyces sp. cf124]|uniref:hypothetical protein n=1 Tax=Streptomyces sp. cf124 TaxID=1761903 RepID=UPI0008F09D49|nr:hypothetical protein [Streptomyces sp. cf124]SFO07163.1 hypothetical protein SAMN04487980_105418 [Streptomyces sp. cf124]
MRRIAAVILGTGVLLMLTTTTAAAAPGGGGLLGTGIGVRKGLGGSGIAGESLLSGTPGGII